MRFLVTELPEPFLPAGLEVLSRHASPNGIILLLSCSDELAQTTAQAAARQWFPARMLPSLQAATSFAVERSRDAGEWPTDTAPGP